MAKKKKKMKQESYTIYMIKAGIHKAEDILKADTYDITDTIDAGETQGMLYVAGLRKKDVAWLNQFRPYGKKNLCFHSGRPSGVFLTRVKDHTFALTYGSGYHWLRDGAVERRFGLRAALNLLNADQLKGLKTVTLDYNPRATTQTLGRAANRTHFLMTPESDLVERIQGMSLGEDPPLKLEGGDSLKVIGAFDLPELANQLDYYRIAFEDELDPAFAWVDQIEKVDDKRQVEALDSCVLTKLQAIDLETFPLVQPAPEHHAEITAFSVTRGKKTWDFSDLTWTNVLSTQKVGWLALATMDQLKKQKVTSVQEDGEDGPTWSLYQCLAGVVEEQAYLYVLHEGAWYRVAREIYDQVSQRVAQIPVADLGLPLWKLPAVIKKGDNPERKYNQEVVQVWHPGRSHCLDGDVNRFKGQDKYEHCDIQHEDGTMIHVKRYGSSAVLGHLFNQGLVSADSLKNSVKARQKLNTWLPDALKLKDPVSPINPADYHVVFAIANDPGSDPREMPFFARRVLCEVYRKLTEMGFKVSLAAIPLHRDKPKQADHGHGQVARTQHPGQAMAC